MKINLIEYFVQTVNARNHKVAVIEGDKVASFAELRDKALSVAVNLISKCDITNIPVAVFLPKSIETVTANIGITYSGNIYMNLDIKAPVERIKNILNLVQPKFLITNNQYLRIIDSVIPDDVIVILIEDIPLVDSTQEPSLLKRLSTLIDIDPYCIINTSGSTGTPKGVVLNHKSFFDFTEWSIDTLGISDNEIVGSLSPSIFDIYSHELCMMMAKGSTIVLLPETLSAFPIKILEILKKEKVTYIFWVPTIMVNIANMDLLSKIE